MSAKNFLHTGMRLFCYFLAVVALMGTALPLLPAEAWYIRIFDFPRLQLCVIALLALILFIVFVYQRQGWHKLIIALLFTAMVYQGYRIFPYTPLAGEQVLRLNQAKANKAEQLSLLVSNVYMENEDYTGPYFRK